uniref:Cilia- and flagella-associated protein 58 central coiled coil domain-containing protein n=1 Tax=Percolomonas cosmopolitus TaxID=63605 RepID=A0A6U0LU49_9EUKA|mmetsp:Transcript_9221/g.34078  ORF Transcript_9221/g.34078 Transcript_9221/m.34078 type:complete len:952 (+) Transcript_9221:242-3097(+)
MPATRKRHSKTTGGQKSSRKKGPSQEGQPLSASAVLPNINEVSDNATTISDQVKNRESESRDNDPSELSPNFTESDPETDHKNEIAARKALEEQQIREQEAQLKARTEMIDTIQKGTMAFESLEKDFYAILSKLASDKHLESFRAEYRRLHDTLVLSHKNEVRLIKKCHALNQEIVTNAAKVAMAIKLSEEDQNTIRRLKKELSRAWEMVEQTVESDSQSQRGIERLTRELKAAEEILERYRGTDDQFVVMEELRAENLKLKARNTDVDERLTDVYADFDATREKYKDLETELTEKLRELKKYKNENHIIKMDQDKRDRYRKILQDTVTEQKQKMMEMEGTLASHLEKILSYQHLVDEHKAALKEKRTALAVKDRELQSTANEMKKAEKQLDRHMKDHTVVVAEKRKLQLEYDFLQQEYSILQNSHRTLGKEKAKVEFDLHRTQDMHNSDREYVKELQREIDGLRDQIKENERRAHTDATAIDSLRHSVLKERESKQKVVLKVREEQQNVGIAKQHVENLRHHIQEMHEGTKSIKEETFHLHKEKENSLEKTYQLQDQVEQLEQALTLMRLENEENKRIVSEVKQKLTVQRTRYEQVRSDRTAKSFHLKQSKDLISEQQQKLIFQRQQIEQLKKEIVGCEERITFLSKEKEDIRKEKTKLGTNVTERTQQIKELKATIQVMQNENEKLRQMMREGDVVRMSELVRYNNIVRDRDLLGTQVIKRNDHISLLKKKVHIQESIIKKGSHQYRQRDEDCKMLKIKIKELEHKIQVLQKRNSHKEALRGVLTNAQKENKHLKTQLQALSQHLGNPTNVHAWRIVSSKNEGTFDLMVRTQTLQKELLSKRQELCDLQQELIEKDRLCNELRRQFKRMPGPDVQRQLVRYEEQIRKLKEQLKSTTSEMNMFAFQAKEKDLSLKQQRMATGGTFLGGSGSSLGGSSGFSTQRRLLRVRK